MEKTGYTTEVRYPTAAVTLSLIGGLIILLSAIVIAVFGLAYLFFNPGLGFSALIIGILGGIDGLVIISSAGGLRTAPGQHIAFGTSIVVFSLLALILVGGGFFIGSIFAFIGGILALIWK